MSRLFTVSTAGLFGMLALSACASSTQVTELDARIKALEGKLAEMEAKPAAKSAAAGAAAAKPELSPEEKAKEDAALALMKEAQTAMRANDFTTAKAKLAEIQASYAETRAGKAAVRMAEEVNLVGTDAPPIEVEKWFQGNATYGKQATLVLFWEKWCPHCIREMPEMAVMAPKFKGKVEFVGVTKMTKKVTEEDINTFIKDNKIGFPMALEKEGSMSRNFKVTGIPAAALVKDGKVIWRGNPATLDEATLTSLISG